MADSMPGPGVPYPTYPAPVTTTSSPRWIAPTALLLSLLAVGATGWSLFKPAAPTETAKASVFTAAPTDDPKAAACDAAMLVSAGVMRQSNINLGAEPAALETVAANTRLAMAGGAAYLRDNVPSNTPPELAEPLATLAHQLQDAVQHFFVGETSSDPAQSGRLTAAVETTKKISELCK